MLVQMRPPCPAVCPCAALGAPSWDWVEPGQISKGQQLGGAQKRNRVTWDQDHCLWCDSGGLPVREASVSMVKGSSGAEGSLVSDVNTEVEEVREDKPGTALLWEQAEVPHF